ncbi:MAG: putative exported protein of unknown function [Rhizobium sp.]|nr:putative exported protein of unknown function [Rhizobium sp.]
MKRRPLAVAMALACALFAATPAHARHHHHKHSRTYSQSGDPRPHAWCGWWLRHQIGVADRTFNLARAWARYGSNAHGPAVGAIAVWPHHVGIITGRTGTGWILKSGNDGHAVRERERSLRGVIAYRGPSRFAMR